MGKDTDTTAQHTAKKPKLRHASDDPPPSPINAGSELTAQNESNGNANIEVGGNDTAHAAAAREDSQSPSQPQLQPPPQALPAVQPHLYSVAAAAPRPQSLSTQLGLGLLPFWAMCHCCSLPGEERRGTRAGDDAPVEMSEMAALTSSTAAGDAAVSAAPAIVPTPQRHLVLPGQTNGATTEHLIHQYIAACNLYGCGDRINAGVLTTLRFSLPTLRASGSFHDADMLALCEILLPHCNGALSYIRRLDFSIASKEGRLHGKRGFRSHGAFTLSKLLSESQYIKEVFLQRNKIGPYGSSAIFLAASNNPHLRTLVMRKCSIGERGALAFAEHVCTSKVSGLREIDISVNGIGFKGCMAVETALSRRAHEIECDLEGNLVLQEVMNCVTHGLGILLSIIAFFALSHRVKDKSYRHTISCAVYSASLLILYTSSTLYHSFFALQVTRYVFEVLDHCAIYILIAGSYTPYLQIAFSDKPIWSTYLLAFIWLCGICGVSVEAFFSTWKHKPKFSLAMYLGMGWACLMCVPEMVERIDKIIINLLVLGGVGYTSGVPFFVRNNNLDHSIWHCFVLAGSIFHWCGVYIIAGCDSFP